MDNSLVYIVWAIAFIFLLWFRVKRFSSYKKRNELLKNLTPEFFAEKKARTSLSEYIAWLRRWHVECRAQALTYEEKGMKAPEYLVGGLRLMENEMKDIERQTGESLFAGGKSR